jgi:hypothetical protein
MAEFRGTKEASRLAGLVRAAEEASRKTKDRWNLPPIEKGWLRGHAMNIRKSEETCEFGILEVLEFELCEKPDKPGIPVRMSGTYFGNRMLDGTVMDVPDPDPSVRPITPTKIYFSHHRRAIELSSYYPGRDDTPPNVDRLRSILVLVGPAVALVAILCVLYFGLHILHPG